MYCTLSMLATTRRDEASPCLQKDIDEQETTQEVGGKLTAIGRFREANRAINARERYVRVTESVNSLGGLSGLIFRSSEMRDWNLVSYLSLIR